MELQAEDGSVIELSEAPQKELGRGPGVAPHDRTVSRRQVRLQLSKSRVAVAVIGANPICLLHSNGQVHIAKPGTHSSLEAGDKLSLSIQDPVFYTLQSGKVAGGDKEEEGIAEAVARWQRRKQDRLQTEHKTLNPKQEKQREQAEEIIPETELVSRHEQTRTSEDDTDFVKKFGFVMEGSEFERYGKKAHDTSKWEWQIGPRQANDSDEEEEERTGKITTSDLTVGSKSKARRGNGDDDDDWQGDSEGDTKVLLSTGKRRKKEVHTRSHDLPTSSAKAKPVSTSAIKSKTGVNSTKKRKSRAEEEEDDEDDDDDGEDLDGFVVDDAEADDEPEAADDEDEFTDEDEDEEVEEEEELDGEVDEKPLCKYGNKCFRKSKDHLAEFRH